LHPVSRDHRLARAEQRCNWKEPKPAKETKYRPRLCLWSNHFNRRESLPGAHLDRTRRAVHRAVHMDRLLRLKDTTFD
jgi:hypothetical protein